ncbi:MAG: hypothetical protein K2M87_04465 [Muribaculaceae bacterium]|nr:hypothetical protein [Muribaculaceae bacterium]
MATNKRNFKKYADALGASALDEMVIAYHNVEGADREKIAEAIKQVLAAVGKAKCNANIFFDKGHKAFESMQDYAKAKRAFFRSLFNKIETEFGQEVNEALKQFNAALPDAVKAKNKEAVGAK